MKYALLLTLLLVGCVGPNAHYLQPQPTPSPLLVHGATEFFVPNTDREYPVFMSHAEKFVAVPGKGNCYKKVGYWTVQDTKRLLEAEERTNE